MAAFTYKNRFTTSIIYPAMSYKLVILGETWDLYRMSYRDLITDNSLYIAGITLDGKFHTLLHRILFSPKINSTISLPNKSIWNWFLFRQVLQSLNKDTPVVFLLFRSWFSYAIKNGCIDYLRKHFKNCRIVLFLQDIIASYSDPITGGNLNIEKYKDIFDLIISFDRGDSSLYNLKYHHTILSSIDVPIQQQYKSDVFFIGKDKGRLPLIYEVFKKLTTYKLSCKFILWDIPEDERLKYPGLTYIDHLLPYTEVLNYVRNTNCLLEIMQNGAMGATYRTLEAISYNKFLLSNNKALSGSELYDNSYICLFNNAEDITETAIEFIRSNKPERNILQDKIRPVSLISFIESELELNIDL